MVTPRLSTVPSGWAWAEISRSTFQTRMNLPGDRAGEIQQQSARYVIGGLAPTQGCVPKFYLGNLACFWRGGIVVNRGSSRFGTNMVTITMANRKQLIILGAYAASQYFFNVIKQLESDNDSGSDEELVQELINIEVDLKIRGKKRKAIRVENYVEHTILRLSAKQFKDHFRIQPAIFDNLENRLGNMLLRQEATGR